MEKGGESAEGNHVKHPIDDSDSPLIQKTVKGRVYSRLPIMNRDSKTKYIASKYLYPANYTTLYMRMAYINSMTCTTLL